MVLSFQVFVDIDSDEPTDVTNYHDQLENPVRSNLLFPVTSQKAFLLREHENAFSQKQHKLQKKYDSAFVYDDTILHLFMEES